MRCDTNCVRSQTEGKSWWNKSAERRNSPLKASEGKEREEEGATNSCSRSREAIWRKERKEEREEKRQEEKSGRRGYYTFILRFSPHFSPLNLLVLQVAHSLLHWLCPGLPFISHSFCFSQFLSTSKVCFWRRKRAAATDSRHLILATLTQKG